jgi:hypothetical protein
MGYILTFGIPSSFSVPKLVETSAVPDFQYSNRVKFDPNNEKGSLAKLTMEFEKGLEDKLESFVAKLTLGVSSQSETKQLTFTEQFISTFNPASDGLDLLMVERYSQRRAPKHKEKVSVNLRQCRAEMQQHVISNVCTLPAYEEFVMNVAGPSSLPLILDSGASCCVSPCKDDFIKGTYRPSNVKIKDLSRVNPVGGQGMLKWSVRDKDGKVHDIEIEGYHVPHSSVRLLSPQSVIQKFGGDGGFDEFKFILIIPKFGVELHALYGMANQIHSGLRRSWSVKRRKTFGPPTF